MRSIPKFSPVAYLKNLLTLAWIGLAGLDLSLNGDHLNPTMLLITVVTIGLVYFHTIQVYGQKWLWTPIFENSRFQWIAAIALMLLADIYMLVTSGIRMITVTRVIASITNVISYYKLAHDNTKERVVLPDCVHEDEKNENKSNVLDSIYTTLSTYFPLRLYFISTTVRGRMELLALIIIMLVRSWTNFYFSIYASRIVDSLQLTTNSTISTVEEGILSIPEIHLDFRIDLILIYFALKLLCYDVLYMLTNYFKTQLHTDAQSRMKYDIFTRLQSLSLRWHLENETEDVFNLMSSGPYILLDVIDKLYYLIPHLLDMFVTIVYMLKSYPLNLTVIVVTTAFVSSIINYYVVSRKNRVVKEVEASDPYISSRNITFKHFETVSYFTNEEYEKREYVNAFQKTQNMYQKIFVFEQGFNILGATLRIVAEMCVIILVVKSITGGDGLTAGDYLYFQGVFSIIFWPLEYMVTAFGTFQRNATEAQKFTEVMSLTPEITDEIDAVPLPLNSPSGKGDSIEFRNVCFSYVPEREIIKNVNLFISPGSTIALVGRSGSGKSTLTKLIFRFYDVSSGQILVNGKDIRSLQCRSLRQAIGVVPQDIVLFSDTIKNNIHYGNIEEATEEDIRTASVSACLHDRIESLPDKYETEVGKSGLKLSGGEKQRVAIARAALKNPRILILDEATSSLDTSTERQIQRSLEKMCENRTTIIIAHRLSTIVNADQIFVLEDGMLVESGSHKDLVSKKDGVYASMWNLQFCDEREE